MPVTYDGRKTARNEFYMTQWPGGSDAGDLPRPMAEAMGRRAQERAADEAEGGSWVVFADNQYRVYSPSAYPMPSGENVSGVRVMALNDGWTADRSFDISYDGRNYVVTVDGRQVWEDREFYPHTVYWSGSTPRSDVGSDTGFVFGESFGAGSTDLGF